MQPQMIEHQPRRGRPKTDALVTAQPDQSFASQIARFVSDPNVDADKLEKLVNLQRQIMAEEAAKAFNEAMRAAQAEIQPVVRRDKNEAKLYAKLERIDREIRPVYTKHGFSLTFNSSPGRDGAVKVLCTAMHDKGHSKDYELEGDLDTVGTKGAPNKTSIQGLGSSVSYLRRYLTCMIFNIVLENEDNDGNRTKPPVSDEQIMKIEEWIVGLTDRQGIDVRAPFLKYMAVETVGEIKAADYQKAITFLKQKLPQKA